MGRPEESGTVSELACRGPLPNERRQVLDARDGLIVSDKRYALLRKCARASRADGYGLVIEGLILAVGETAMQFSEASALHQEEVEFAQGGIDVRFQYDMKQRRQVASKKPRWVPLSFALQEHLEGMSGSGPIVFPAIRGDYRTPSNFYSHWDAVRVAAGTPSAGGTCLSATGTRTVRPYCRELAQKAANDVYDFGQGTRVAATTG